MDVFECERLTARYGERERADGLAASYVCDGDTSCRGHVQLPVRLMSAGRGRNVGAGFRNQIEYGLGFIRIGSGILTPALDGMRQRRAWHELIVDVIAGAIVRARVGHLKAALERDR